uniref:Uncharacterized protein n=1 Tax=Chaetoceros debilis TaxID=122233 RepID=A0A7S3V5X8_9STRA|mmetsp:Transcript_3023/g.4456  ORF Transcript_3023/g.4456 Transcript_3023/m.4456 type:complete len:591 (+) Transcript_3023:177-1949(+)|eukprot:CAMPEP_0194118048 /NCGR_PEP_ID=MMETSP0150-20130528/33910_1 /TAXON_ID=122233 /ORGANISM="Chaetoceros debilis, Strain MM31A-1" /LENGTH=590 /DNA_ID=CAMNT_0038809291 /DNA_START=82 /DNA_END=1854 /DNA_ORIENTATION=-
MISNTALGLLIALLSSSPYFVSSYVTSGLPGPKHRAWLKEMTVEVCDTAPGELSQEMCNRAPQLLSAWAKNPYTKTKKSNWKNKNKKNGSFVLSEHEGFPHHGKECAMFCEKILKRLVDERRAGNMDAIANTQSYNALIDVWSRTKEHGIGAQRAEQIVVGMQDAYSEGEVDVQPDLESFRLVLQAWSLASSQGQGREEHAPHRAQRMLEWMLMLYDSGENALIQPDGNCFEIVLNAWAKSNHKDAPRKTEELIMQMDRLYSEGNYKVKPNRMHFNQVLTAWSKSKPVDMPSPKQRQQYSIATARRAESILNHMNTISKGGETDYHPDNIYANAEQRTIDSANHDISPNIATYSAVCLAWAKSKHDDCGRRAEKILKQVEHRFKIYNDVNNTPDTILYNMVIDAHSKTSSNKAHVKSRAVLDRQINMVKKYGNKKCRPDVYSFTSVLASCASLNGSSSRKEKLHAFEIARSTFDEMCRSDVQPNHVTYGTMLKACGRLLPLGKERRKFTREYFRKACDAGCVGDMVLDRLKDAASPIQYNGLLNGHTRNTLPAEWTSQVPKNDNRRNTQMRSFKSNKGNRTNNGRNTQRS